MGVVIPHEYRHQVRYAFRQNFRTFSHATVDSPIAPAKLLPAKKAFNAVVLPKLINPTNAMLVHNATVALMGVLVTVFTWLIHFGNGSAPSLAYAKMIRLPEVVMTKMTPKLEITVQAHRTFVRAPLPQAETRIAPKGWPRGEPIMASISKALN